MKGRGTVLSAPRACLFVSFVCRTVFDKVTQPQPQPQPYCMYLLVCTYRGETYSRHCIHTYYRRYKSGTYERRPKTLTKTSSISVDSPRCLATFNVQKCFQVVLASKATFFDLLLVSVRLVWNDRRGILLVAYPNLSITLRDLLSLTILPNISIHTAHTRHNHKSW
jgi:hypothetical protein